MADKTSFIPLPSEVAAKLQDNLVLSKVPKEYHQDYIVAAKANNVPLNVLVHSGYMESRFHPDARNKESGAMGIAQFMPRTWGQYGHGSPYDPHEAIAAAGRYFGHLGKMFNNDPKLMLAAYNHGEGNIQRWLKDTGGDVSKLPAETQKYIAGMDSNAIQEPQAHDPVSILAGIKQPLATPNPASQDPFSMIASQSSARQSPPDNELGNLESPDTHMEDPAMNFIKPRFSLGF